MCPERQYSGDLESDMSQLRDFKVVKSNDLIQRSRFQLSLQEQKIVLFLISKIRPEDIDLKEYAFKINEFCKVCGIDTQSGASYKYIKKTLKELRDRSIWVNMPDGSETTLAWIDKVTMTKNSGTVKIKIDSDMKPYLLQLKERFTQYELLYTLAMRSQYSIRLYELLKSYEYQRTRIFDIEDLKKSIFAENYTRFPDFKRVVLDTAMREINDLSDISVTYEIIKEGRRFAKLEFNISLKEDVQERLQTLARIDEALNPSQMSIFEKMLQS